MTYVIICVDCHKRLSSFESGMTIVVEKCRCNNG